jgi:hypothetical protein
MTKKQKSVDYAGLIVSALAGLISIWAQYNDPETSILSFLLIIGAILIYFIISWPIGIFKRRFRIIDTNKNSIEAIRKDLNNVKERLDLKGELSDLSARVSLIEKVKMKNKRGQIDPRWIVIIIIIVLLILFLRDKGLI